MAVEIRAATYAALRTALAAGTYQAGQMVFVEADPSGNPHIFQVVDNAGGEYVNNDATVLTGGTLAAKIVGTLSSNGANSYVLNPVDEIESGVSRVFLMTASDLTFASKIGVQSKPVGTANSNSDPLISTDATKEIPWADDTAYPGDNVDVAMIVGGYDNVNNQEAGTLVGGGHNYIQHHVSGHSTLIGGSNNRVASGRGTLAGGLNNTITADGYGAFVGGGTDSTVRAVHGAIIAGKNALIDTGADYSAVIAGRDARISSLYSLACGGVGADAIAPGVYFGRRISAVGDCQSAHLTFGVRTTSDALVNLTLADLTMYEADAAEFTVAAGKCVLSGVDEATGGAAVFTADFGFKWDGTTARIYTAGVGASTRDFTTVIDEIGLAGVPHLSSSEGFLRPKVYGKASTNIKWCASIQLSIVRMA